MLAVTSCAQTPPSYIVSTFAGSVPNGDGGPAASAIIRWPSVLVFDNAGNLYLADQGNASVREVTPDGIIHTLAGTGETGFGGDGGPASRSQLSADLSGLAFDSKGNLYISDSGNNRIRMISATDGTIRTVVDGSKLPQKETEFGFNAIAFDGADNLYIADGTYSQIFRVAADGTFSVFAGTGKYADNGDGGPATKAALEYPLGLWFDTSGALYVSDYDANRIRKITADGMISTVAGSGKSGFAGDGGPAAQAVLNGPTFFAADAAGNLYVLDNSRVRRIGADGNIATVAGAANPNAIDSGDGGPATQATFRNPAGLAVSVAGDLYISSFNSAIRVVTAADGLIQTAYGAVHFAGDGGPVAEALFTWPQVIASDPRGNLYVADSEKIRKIDTNGSISTIAGNVSAAAGNVFYVNSGDGGPATAAALQKPFALIVDAAGNVYFGSGPTVRRIGADGIITTVAGGGTTLGDGGPATQAKLGGNVFGLAVDAMGALYISDASNHRIRKVTPDGMIATYAGTGTSGNGGNGGPANAATINRPTGLVFDAIGNLYFADANANVVRKITPDGTISLFAGSAAAGETGDGGAATKAKLNGPANLGVDAAGNVYIVDAGGNTLRVVTADGNIHTIASGTPVDLVSNGAFGGDGRPAIGADYCNINAIAFDGSSNIYLVDSYNERIRVLTPMQ
jgi:sugar lactone lactonase YvrE